ncbi:MAG: hypothetical protein QGG04_08310, partial [Candidatus Marinimicrobia bacterium]|nr:hypothetical protein [Candidatus Neomarinimicrobiota bacterium]
MKLEHKIMLVNYLAFTSAFLFAGEVIIANQDRYNPSLQTYPDYDNHQVDEQNNSDGNYSYNPEMITMSRDGETIYQFTSCGQSGYIGPSQSQINSEYTGT